MRDTIVSAILGFLLFILIASGYRLVKESLPTQIPTSTEVQPDQTINEDVYAQSSDEDNYGGPRKKHNKPKKHRHHFLLRRHR
jgi:hypothetical protein